jgi:TRAP-type C4-dicarboxylate transport system substrate-binding protein
VHEARQLRVLVRVAAIAAVTAACAAPRGPIGDKAGGAPGGRVVLRMALTGGGPLGGTPAIFAKRVETLSRGNVRIDAVYQWGSFTPPAEQEVVRAVASDTVDIGVVGTRVFDTLGVASLRAITAPMLIDSYGLENAFLHSSVPGKMLDALGKIHVTGLAMLASGLRKPIGIRPLLRPGDWRGLTFSTYLSETQIDAIRGLGATPKVAFGSFRWQGLTSGQIQGYEFNLLAYNSNSAWAYPPRDITANVTLWPEMLLIVANPDRLATLTPRQRGWLEQAAREASARSIGLIETETGLTKALCSHGVRFANASEADLAALRQAFASVYARLEKDPQTRTFIDEIQALKRSISAEAPLTIPSGCGIGKGSG